MSPLPFASAAAGAGTSASSGAPAYRLVRTPLPPPTPVRLDAAQQAVVDHRGGPLLVLAGPGTGKTTTLVEAVADRVERGGLGGTPLDPARVLVLTFGRKAADELRSRVTTRLGRTTTEAMAWTFHGFCYALLRRYQDAAGYADPLRLLSGPEQHAVVRELLAGSGEAGTSRWPGDLQGLLPRRGFVEEVRRLLARVRQLGLDPIDLAELAGSAGRPDWGAAAAFCEEYLDVLALRGVLDYGELVRSAAALAGTPDVRAALRASYDVVFVDEYQDTDPAQEELLRQLAGDGRDLVVVGDPDQSIYAFRGADVAGILEFAHRFPTRGGASAPVRALQTSRRAGPALLGASRSIARRLPLPGLGRASMVAHRELTAADAADGGPESEGLVEVQVFASTGLEVEAVADLLRRAHLEQGVAWSRMAVLVRSGTRSIPTLRRALATHGVPVDVAGDELPLVREPAVRALLLALTCAADGTRLTEEAARDLLLSPLGLARPAQLRRLARSLRALDRERDASEAFVHRGSDELLRAAVADARETVAVDDAVARPVDRLRTLLAAATAVLDGGGTVEDGLWALWSGTGWPGRLSRASYRGGAGGRRADADLDAVVALFEIAGRAEERTGRAGVADFVQDLEAQQIPADTLAEKPVRDEFVRLLTAHRAKGLEWDVVVVPGVQEGVWPDLRRRDSLLGSERIGRTRTGGAEATEPPGIATLLVEERRLFYVAATRARHRLVVTAVADADVAGDRPSRFLDELGVPSVVVAGRARRALALPALVAELRAASVDPTADETLRRAATLRLARLARATGADGRPLVAAAHPATWWGVAEPTDPGVAMRGDDDAIRLSGSGLERIAGCPRQWFLEREARAVAGTTTAAGFGSIVHAIAAAVSTGAVEADLDVMAAHVDAVWDRLDFDIPWHSHRERTEARAALQRFLAWHGGARGRTTVGAEIPLEFELTVSGRRVVVRGRLDRVEVDADGRVWVVDFKTSKSAHTKGRVAADPQLAIYQVAVREGALATLDGVGDDAESGGAELVYLRKGTRSGQPTVVTQPPLGEPGSHPAEEQLATAVERIAAERFPAIVGEMCSYCAFRRSCPADSLGQQVVS